MFFGEEPLNRVRFHVSWYCLHVAGCSSDYLSPGFEQITSYNGSAVLAMVGKECVAVASDRRFGAELQTIACDFERVFKIHDHLFVGLSGLGTDVQTLYVSIFLALHVCSIGDQCTG